MSDTPTVSIAETPITVSITDNSLTISITNNSTSTIEITNASKSVVTVSEENAVPDITIDGAGAVTVEGGEKPNVTVNLGVGGAYDVSTLLTLLLGQLDLTHIESGVATDLQRLRDMWTRIGNDLLLTYPEGTSLVETAQTQTNLLIASTAAALKVTIDGEVDLKLSTIEQTAESIDSRVTALQISVAGDLSLQDSRITQNANSIISTVTDILALEGITTLSASAISQLSDSIALEVIARTLTDAGLVEAKSSIVLNTSSIAAAVESWDSVEGRLAVAEILLAADSITLSVTSAGLTASEQALTTVAEILANQFSVNITETVGGYEYSTGFRLIINPLWVTGTVYAIDDTCKYDDLIYRCETAHTATVLNNPGSFDADDYWIEVVGGQTSEFAIIADQFYVQASGENAVKLFIVDTVTKEVSINANLIIDGILQSVGYVSGSAGYKLDPDNNTAEFHDMVMTFGSSGQTAAQEALNVIDEDLLMHDDDVTKIDGGKIYAGSQVLIGNNVDGDYCLINAGDILFYQYIASAHRLTKSLKRIETGTANNGIVTTIPGYFDDEPQIIISPHLINTFMVAYNTQDQRLQLSVKDLGETSADSGQYKFTPIAQLIAGSGSVGEAVNVVGSSSSTTATSAAYTIVPSNVKQVIVNVTGKGLIKVWTHYTEAEKVEYSSRNIKIRLEWYNGSWNNGTYSSIKESKNTLQSWTLTSTVSTPDITQIRVTVAVDSEGSIYYTDWSDYAPANSTELSCTLHSYSADLAAANVLDADGVLNWIAIG